MSADFYNVPAHELLPLFMSPDNHGEEPMPDAVVVNNEYSGGNLTFHTSRKTRQLVRVINAAAWSMFTITVDGMPLLLVELDGTAVDGAGVFAVRAAQRRAARQLHT
jgi:TPP-dependent pyruvate/acetoin dehydrogenase alpha subunit